MGQFIFDDGNLVMMRGHFPYPTISEMDQIRQTLSIIEERFGSDDEIEKYNDYYFNKMQNQLSSMIKEETKKTGYVYFIKDINGKIKIGKAIDINNRFDKYITENAEPVELIHSIKYNSMDYSKAEKMRHNRFKHKNHNRERFNLDKKDIKFILSKGDDFII